MLGVAMLKIKLDVSEERKADIQKTLEEHGLVISDDADLVIIENLEHAYLTCKKDDKLYKVLIDDIIYMESQDHDLIIRTIDDIFRIRETISYYEKHLPSNFMRVHRSYIVNINKIQYIKPLLGNTFILKMETNEKIPVSRSYYFYFKEKIGI